jgi:aryl-alcohol dehydrogenase-like predicted oxidoreductase
MAAILERTVRDDILTATMPTRPLGGFGWQSSIITMGGVKWDTLRSDDEAVALIHRAIELGVNTFDTAHAYGNGESERKLGLALQGIRDRVWVNTKIMDRTYDGAMKQMEESLNRLQMDRVDLMFVHSLDDEDNYRKIMAPNSVLRAVEEFRAAGRIRHVGISGHWAKDVMARIIQEYRFEAVLFPVGLFNLAYGYSFVETVLPIARERGMAVLGMKVMGAGRIKLARNIEPYLRYSLGLPIDTAVIGVDNIAQLEENIRIAKQDAGPLGEYEQQALYPEAIEITQSWDAGEFSWVDGYRSPH